MDKPTKAALLSALVFPGAGHFLLKRYVSGAVLAGAAFGGLYSLTTRTIDRVLQIAEIIQSSKVQLDAAGITEIVSKQSTGAEVHLLNIAMAVLVASWLIGIIDSYRVGRIQDREVADR